MGSLAGILLLAMQAEVKGKGTLAKGLFIGGIYWASMIYPFFPIFHSSTTASIFLYIFILLLLSSLSVVVYRPDQWKIIVTWISVVLVTCYFGMADSIQKLETENPTLGKLFAENKDLTFAILVCAVIFAVITWVLKVRQGDLQKLLKEASVELSQNELDTNSQNQKLTELAANLKNTHLEIEKVNSSLEHRIAIRSKELQNINDKIVNHGFMHSKLIKNAFESNVVFADQLESLDDKTIQSRTKKMTSELDRLVFQIAKNLETAERTV